MALSGHASGWDSDGPNGLRAGSSAWFDCAGQPHRGLGRGKRQAAGECEHCSRLFGSGIGLRRRAAREHSSRLYGSCAWLSRFGAGERKAGGLGRDGWQRFVWGGDFERRQRQTAGLADGGGLTAGIFGGADGQPGLEAG